MEIFSIGSSSSGNSYVIKNTTTVFLLDVGLSATKIIEALSALNIGLDEVKAVFITHEHIDHVRSIRAISKKCENAEVYVSSGTYNSCSNLDCVDNNRIRIVASGDDFIVSDVKVKCFGLSHDAEEPIGFSFYDGEMKLCIVTDTGIITDEIFDQMKTSNKLVFEANHEEDLLMYSEYPYNVKMRIKSDVGHLSNDYAGEILERLLSESKSETAVEIMLAHLSEKNNTPNQARSKINDFLSRAGFKETKDYKLCVAMKEGLTRL